MREIKGYKIDGKIFILPLVISLVLLSTLIYIEGFDVLKKTEIYYCPDESYFGNCEFDNGLKLIPGETVILNEHDNVLIQYFNSVPLILIIIGLIINHYKHNRRDKTLLPHLEQ